MNNPLVQLDPGLFVWTIVTFLLLLTVLSKFAWKPLLKMLKEREEFIRSSLEDAEKAQRELAKLNAEGEKIINKARSEAQKILSQGKASAVKMKEEILIDSKEKAKTIADNAENQIRIEKDKAIADIKGEVVNLSISMAEKLIRKNLSADENKALIDESLSKIKKYEA